MQYLNTMLINAIQNHCVEDQHRLFRPGKLLEQRCSYLCFHQRIGFPLLAVTLADPFSTIYRFVAAWLLGSGMRESLAVPLIF